MLSLVAIPLPQFISWGKFQSLKNLQDIANLFYHENASPDEIGNVMITFFELLNSKSGESLPVIRKRKYEEMVMSNRVKIDPLCLPLSPRAAYFHGLRFFIK